MAFKKKSSTHAFASDPAALFKTFTKREFQDVMPHQKEVLETFARNFADKPDVALQLPTGSGKTLVGLLIADWQRRKNNFRAVYLCPNHQLVNQTVLQATTSYGMDVVNLAGSKDDMDPNDKAAFLTGSKIAVSTYSGLFNTNPFFSDPDLILIDDAHAAENYISGMWSLHIEAGTPLHSSLAEFLRSHIDAQSHARLTGDWEGIADATWVDKLPTPVVKYIKDELCSIIDSFALRDQPNLYFPWSLIRDHIDGCHVYLGSREILIRPIIAPTSTHAPFANAKQRIYMSATLGLGGDLERITGRESIQRLEAPADFQSAGVGRRYFIFPSLSLTGDESDKLCLKMQKRAGRSVILIPSSAQAQAHEEYISENLPNFAIFSASDIEADKEPFVATKKAVAVLANRYDGIDFPGDECRLLFVDSLPRATNAQERFIMAKMAATALYNERIQSRILQAVGRCTRALQDRSAVVITGTELVDYLADNRKWQYLYPELQAELDFGVEQSKNVQPGDFWDNFETFMENDADWEDANRGILDDIPNRHKVAYAALADLENTVAHEVRYQGAMWRQDFRTALAEARNIIGKISHPDLRGYRALWHYLAATAATYLSSAKGDTDDQVAREQFGQARRAAPTITWLNSLAEYTAISLDTQKSTYSPEVLAQVEAIEQQFIALGTAHNRKFDKLASKICSGLAHAKTFEAAQKQLGDLLGFTAGNSEVDAAPDPWWLGKTEGVVFEDHADGKSTTEFGATKARQAAGHPKWIAQNVPGAAAMKITSIIVTPCSKLKKGAVPHMHEVLYWRLDDFLAWADHTISVLRDLKSKFSGEGDLVWRAEASAQLEKEAMTLSGLKNVLAIASEAMTIVD